MPSKDRRVAKKTEAEFKKKARAETFAESAVEGSLDRMAGSSQRVAKAGGKVRDKLRRKAKELTHA
jgi:hypothetical protein